MRFSNSKRQIAAWAIAASVMCLAGTGPANAVTFDFAATCDTCVLPLGLAGSPVSGELVLTDSLLTGGAVLPNTTFTFASIESFSLTFQTSGFPDPSPDPDVFNTIALGIGGFIDPFGGPATGSAGIFNSAGDGIQSLLLADTVGQIFQVDFGTDAAPGSAFWGVLDQAFNLGTGTPISFDVPAVVPAPEPGSLAIFSVALATLAFAARRQRQRAGTRFQSEIA